LYWAAHRPQTPSVRPPTLTCHLVVVSVKNPCWEVACRGVHLCAAAVQTSLQVSNFEIAQASTMSARGVGAGPKQKRKRKEAVVAVNGCFRGCYLLSPVKQSVRTYIGYTVNPLRRLRQHNGVIKVGAMCECCVRRGVRWPQTRREWSWNGMRPLAHSNSHASLSTPLWSSLYMTYNPLPALAMPKGNLPFCYRFSHLRTLTLPHFIT
jgi:hypothetical protein